jgi:4-oxalocrotonate tautomerase
MPVVKVDMWKGKTEEQKEKLIEGITKAFIEIGMKAEWVTVIFNEVPKSNWGMGGKQASKVEHK